MNGFSIIQSIYIKLGIFFLLTLSISIGSYYFISSSLTEEKNISHMINVAGRERMLTEKINKKAIQIVYMESGNMRRELQLSIQEFEKNFYDLTRGNERIGLVKINNEEISNQFQKVEQNWESLKEDLNALLLEKDNDRKELLLNQITLKSNRQVASLEALVSSIEKKGRENFQGLNTEKMILAFSNVLLIIVLFVTWRLFIDIKNSERKYRLLIDHSPMGIITITKDKINFINKMGLQTIGATNVSDVIGKSIYTFVNRRIKYAVKIDELTELKCKRLDNSEIDIEYVCIPFDIMGDKTMMIIFRDITEKIQSKNKVENIYTELTNIKTALDVSSIVEVTDKNGIILYVNDKFCDISKYPKEEVIGNTHRLLKSGHHSNTFYKNLWNTVLQGNIWEGQVKNRAKDGSFYWVQTIIVPFINKKGEPYQFITIRNDITDIKKAEQEIKILATRDHLTNLYNRRKFEDELNHALSMEEQVAVLFLDIDRFKFINDSLGHGVGDKLIKLVAQRLKSVVDTSAIVSRQGGDEFTILIKNKNKDFITNLAKEIIQTIKYPYMIDQKEILITCSIGISIFPDHGRDIETLMKNADVAMYYAKEKGKDDFSFYKNHMEQESARIMRLELELRKAVEKEEFVLYYQPKLNLITEEVVGCEALIRWEHPTMGIISPGEFIPLAEETGLINQIGEWVLREACIQNKKWHEAGYSNFVVAVNMSAYQFKQPTIVSIIDHILKDTQLEPRFLELEITESISMLNEEYILKQLHDIKKLGISLAIDDFGTGYSSLKYLEKFPVDTLKIDKTFIDKIVECNNSTSSLMTNAVISLAKSLNMKVVAEGIEEEEQLNYLKQSKCDLGQGYLFSKPLPVCELERKLTKDNNNVYFH